MRASLIATAAKLPMDGHFAAEPRPGHYPDSYLLGELASGACVYHVAPETPLPPETASVICDGAAAPWTWDDPRVSDEIRAFGLHFWAGDES